MSSFINLGLGESMQEILFYHLLLLRKKRLVQITQKTLVSVFPFMLLTAILLVFSESIFNDVGFINSLFGISKWFPSFTMITSLLSHLVLLFVGLMAPLTTYFAAKYTAGSYGRSTGTAGISAFLFSLIFYSRELFEAPRSDNFLSPIHLSVHFNLLLAILIGYVIGHIFRLSNPLDDEIVDEYFIYRPRTMRPIIITTLFGIISNLLLILARQYKLTTSIEGFLTHLFFNGRGIIQVSINSILRSLSAWVGSSSPYKEIGLLNDNDALTNLNAALGKGSSNTIPFLFTDTNLYAAYGALAGIGGMVAFIVAILWKSTSRKNQSVGLRSLFPALFNHGASCMVGIPIFFNLIYVIPFLLVPVINVLLAAVFLSLKLMPPAVYPVPNGTPNILYAFIGSVGNLRSLIVSLVLFAVDVFIYVPFVQLDNRLHDYSQQHGGNEQ
ncbi:PTS sugar transporter subunit IIC [Streptococcus iniae]|nr:PTS sugar transporter subunit IIC [Streptococcus iniae]WHL21711.1 PTS sugar transporter subunit IIC [Streptococcus iniae]WKZ88914.1 PTS sugar transporter subunit IIC [Streptococcus iniae]WLR88685.1 PTS sugar transporter subunit IIC [Streptococcus iniae]WLR89003.1 PTS sugar transporter subunit IIC [Streptococcus iniae]